MGRAFAAPGNMALLRSSKRFFYLALTFTLGAGAGCSSDRDHALEEGAHASTSEALTDAQARVLGFETPTSDWSSPQVTLASTTTANEGAQALSLNPLGWTEINSIALSSLGAVHDVISVDVRLPVAMPWGELRIVLMAPSLGMWWHELPAASLTGLAPGAFHTLSFPVSDALQTALAGSYSDLRIKLIVNAPGHTIPYVIDRLSIVAASPEPPDLGGTSPYGSLVQVLPAWALPRVSAATALHELRVNDRVRVETPALAPANVASLGSLETNLGVESAVGDITSIPSVVLRDRAVVFGDAISSGNIGLHAGAAVHGTSSPHMALDAGSVDFRLDLGPRGPDFQTPSTSVLAPGRYGRVAVQGSGATMRFSSGVYALNDLYVASDTELLIDGSGGPVVVLVTDSANIHGRVRDVGGGFPHWILAYSGTQEVLVGLRLDGAYFAPNAKLNVATTPFRHEGAVLGKDVELHQRALFVHNYYAPVWQRLCEILGGRGGFCPQVTSAPLDCALGTHPWAVGRNGRDPGFPIGFERPGWEDACRLAGFDLTAFVGLKEDEDYQTPRAMVGLRSNYVKVFGTQWAPEVRADEIAFGDVDGDGRDEVVIGRGPAGNGRLLIQDDSEAGFAPIQELFGGWDNGSGVRALALADFDGDGRDEIAVGRNAPGGQDEVFLLDGVPNESACGAHISFQQIDSYDAGDRMVRGLAFGDVDNDGFIELVMARDGNDDAIADRIVVKEVAEGGAVRGFGSWDGDRDATALAIGDFEKDGTLEIAVGRGAGSGARVEVYRYNPAVSEYEKISDLHGGWASSRSTTALAFGNLDDDEGDELVVGRNGCDACSGPDARVSVHDFQGTPNTYPVIREIGGAEDWGKGRAVSGLAIGDVDGDGVNELMIGRDEGGGGRLLVFGGAREGFAQSDSIGDGWGDDRGVRSVAIAPRPVCQARSVAVRPVGDDVTPASVDDSKARFNDRLAEVVEAVIGTFLPALSCEDPTASDFAVRVLGEWGEEHANTETLRRMLAGFAAIQLAGSVPRLADEASALTGLGFPALVNQYILDHVEMFTPVGTGYDFDFEQMGLIGLVYRFRNTPDPANPSTFLLSETAVQKILHLDCAFGPICPDRTEPHMLQADLHAEFDPGKYCVSELLTPSVPIRFSLPVPETENHVLMINTWHYLVHQWNESSTPRAGSGPADALPTAATTELEDKLMEIVARVVKNDMWETNSRAYSAFSIRPLQMLASYAGSARLRRGAQNALDFLAAKFTFQSLHGKRLAPMRRNFKYKDRLGIYENDYVPALFGVLTGDRLFDTSPSCTQNCQYRQHQPRGFALESALSLYRVPDVILDHMLNPDGNQPGFGSWARMQSRYTEDHYRVYHDPAYHELGRPGEAVEPAHEFYFRTGDYLNSAGGRREHYSTWENQLEDATNYAIWAAAALNFNALLAEFGEDAWLKLFEDYVNSTDFLAKPTLLLGNHDNGYWLTSEDAALETLWMPGAESIHDSNNTGVYKNFALGYGNLNIPPQLTRSANASANVGSAFVTAVDSFNTRSLFADANYHLVIGQMSDGRGFWEVVPKGLFSGAPALLARVVALNSSGLAASPPVYTTVVSGEAITINPSYPSGVPFLAIDGAPPTHLHHTSHTQTESFPLMDVRQVDASYRSTGVHYACANGDGRLIVHSTNLNRQLVIDSRDSQNPLRNEAGTLVNPCPTLLALPP